MTRAAQSQAARIANVNVVDADWAERVRKRIICIELIKASDLYLTPWSASTQEPIPTTPDPYDRSKSKRVWERGIQKWKKELQIHRREVADPQINDPIPVVLQ